MARIFSNTLLLLLILVTFYMNCNDGNGVMARPTNSCWSTCTGEFHICDQQANTMRETFFCRLTELRCLQKCWKRQTHVLLPIARYRTRVSIKSLSQSKSVHNRAAQSVSTENRISIILGTRQEPNIFEDVQQARRIISSIDLVTKPL